MKTLTLKSIGMFAACIAAAGIISSCKPKKVDSALSGDAAAKVYVAPGKYDEVYLFTSGGFSGQIGVYGIAFRPLC
jgi:nitrous-oxide reductase